MTLKEELEILRGEPIEVYNGDPMDIPCIETSDQEKLCKNPVVSVHMITYNHELYIRQAIEGVMMQKTDFEFELVIGEDCSQDKTREICFEYQKKYPDKIRVLWWHENVSKLGGNGRRTSARCRGEFIAFCEGDDYWIDPLKLQKQVDIMRQHKNVHLCFCDSKGYYQDRNALADTWWGENWGNSHVISGTDFCAGQKRLITCSAMIRTNIFRFSCQRYEIFQWQLFLGDLQIWIAMNSFGDSFYINEKMAVYRIHQCGITKKHWGDFLRDLKIVETYYSFLGILPDTIGKSARQDLGIALCGDLSRCNKVISRERARQMLSTPVIRNCLTGWMKFFLRYVSFLGYWDWLYKFARNTSHGYGWIFRGLMLRMRLKGV